ncbi:MAG TPA: ABC transporter ATP-binding protein [Gemmataceae bacterium]|jgi:lipoprotein-releasing system ATP-binding protein|nr:ABC transporter ATP-binding protein [Gemmataceae bacterium]
MLVACNLHKTFRRNANQVQVLNGLSLEVTEGEFLSVTGASGSGKSTLLHLLGTLDQPDSGEIHLGDQRIDNLPQRERDQLRSQTFGFIFQFYHLLPELSMLENVLMPTMIHASAFRWLGERRAFRKRAVELLERFGLGHRLKHRPRELSGGEMQRTAIARALICHPRILLADEPTGNLDAEAGHEIINILRDLNQRDGLTIIMVTHNQEMAASTDRVVRLVCGRVEAPEPLAA